MKRKLRGSLLLVVIMLLSLGLVNTALAGSDTWSGQISTDDPIWTWYVDNFEAVFYYDVCNFRVDVDGTYTFTLIGGSLADRSLADADFTLAFAPFVPDQAATGYIAYAQESGGGLSIIQENLAAGVEYALVTSTFVGEQTGTYENRISGPGQVSLDCGGGGPDSGSSPIAGNLLDGRINNSPALDVAAPVAVYCPEGGGFDVYAIDPNTGDGTLVARVTAAELAAMTPLFTENEVLGGSLGVTVYRLMTGGYQVNGSFPDGKPYSFAWDACPPTNKNWPFV